MKVRISYTINISDEGREVLAAHQGGTGLATREDIQEHYERYGRHKDMEIWEWYSRVQKRKAKEEQMKLPMTKRKYEYKPGTAKLVTVCPDFKAKPRVERYIMGRKVMIGGTTCQKDCVHYGTQNHIEQRVTCAAETKEEGASSNDVGR